MAYAGSEALLKGLLLAALESTLPNDESKPIAMKNLEKTADAMAKAIVAWQTTAGVGAVQGAAAGSGVGSGQGANAGGPVVTVVNTGVNATVTGNII